MRGSRRAAAGIAGVVVLLATSCATRLGTLGGWESEAVALNAHGTIVGTSTTADNAWHPFVRTAGGALTDLGLPAGLFPEPTVVPTYGVANSVNDLGTVVGLVRIAGYHWSADAAFRWTEAGGMVGLPGFAAAIDINGAGLVVGRSQQQRAGVFEPGADQGTDLPFLPGVVAPTYSSAEGVNERGDIVGCSDAAAGGSRPVWWSGPAHTIHELSPELPGGGCLEDINDDGIAVGAWFRDGVRVAATWDTSTGVRTDIADNATAVGINDDGLVVGSQLDADLRWRAFRWTAAGGLSWLGTSTQAPAGSSTLVSGVNDAGTAVGWERDPNQHDSALTW